MGKLSLRFVDHNRESSNVSLRLADIGDVGGMIPGDAGVAIQSMNDAADLIIATVNNVSLGLHVATGVTYRNQLLAAPTAAAASQDAQRERKWLVRFYDTVNFKAGSFEIPAADLSILMPNSEYMDMTQQPGLGLKNALESGAVSVDGNPIVVYEAVHVGRNT